MEIKRPNTPQDGTLDGITGVTECVRTDFTKNQANGSALFAQNNKSESHISASVETGIFSIRDMETGVMLTVTLVDAMEVMAMAVDAAKEAESCMEKTSGSAEAAGNA